MHMTFSDSVQTVFKKYFVLRGRASRSEFWYFALFTVIVSAILSGLAYMCGSDGRPSGLFTTLDSIFGVAILLPAIAVTVRRLHDTGRGGGWIFIQLLPIVGSIWLFVLEILPGQIGGNRFGNPS